MVPLADIFNHKAALVKLSDDYQLERACLEDESSSEASDSKGQPLTHLCQLTRGSHDC